MLAVDKKIQSELRRLDQFFFSEVKALSGWVARRCHYDNPGSYRFLDADYFPLAEEVKIGGKGITVFLKNQLTLDDSYKGKKVALLASFGGEGCLSVNGRHYNGMDFNRFIIPLVSCAKGDEHYDFEAEVNCKDFLPDSKFFAQVGMAISRSQVAVVDQKVWDYSFRTHTIFDYASKYPEEFARDVAYNALYASFLKLDYTSRERLDASIDEADAELTKRLKKLEGIKIPETVYAVGHSHIDIAWHWPLKETYRKTSRTFSSTLRLLEDYPDFIYSQSMPALYEMVESTYPELFAQMKKRIAEGRWETLGCMYLEPDCNLISGESFVRQIMFGKRYWKEKFGTDSRICFLPDTFGFSPAMPQILKKSGTDYFFTSKLGWQETNRFPHSVFQWKGLDGSMVLSGMMMMYNFEQPKLYNGDGSPKGVIGSLGDFRNKEDELPMLYLYGYGDGGGGVTLEMLEQFKRAEAIPLAPHVKETNIQDYFDAVEQASVGKQLPVWDGPLYFEKHRGTYTSIAKNKRNNRRSEFLYRNAELTSVLRYLATGKAGTDLTEGWKLILLNAFDDLLPGTAITEVYELSDKQYEKVFEAGKGAIEANFSALGKDGKEGFSVFNPHAWDLSMTVHVPTDGTKCVVDEEGKEVPQVPCEGGIDFVVRDLPAFTTRSYHLAQKEICRMKTGRKETDTFEAGPYRIRFNKDGELASCYDTRYAREILKEGLFGNRFELLEDIPVEWGSAWETTMKRFDKPSLPFETVDFHLVDENELYVAFELTRKSSHSLIKQSIRIDKVLGMIAFHTHVDWDETHKTLRVAFPVEIRARQALCECAFGNYEVPNHRSTSNDEAMFEVCAHKWIDLSEGDYGVSILNDSTYGHIVNDSVMSLTLLRSSDHPADFCDKGVHEFAYYFYPHEGDYRSAETYRLGYQVNNPLMVIPHRLSLKGLIRADQKDVVIETIKMAEDGDGIIVRCYEACGEHKQVKLTCAFAVASCLETDLLERPVSEVHVKGSACSLTMKPFEIKTLRIRK